MSTRRILDNLSSLPQSVDGATGFRGYLKGDDNYIVHGEVYGHSDIRGVLMIADDCRWKGNITATVVIVKGQIEGNITARSKIELRNGAKVRGRLSAPSVALAHGATLQGPIDENALVVHFQERRDQH